MRPSGTRSGPLWITGSDLPRPRQYRDMTFEDLPRGWAERPLTDPLLAVDVVDLCLPERSRAAHCLAILLCDGDAKLVQPCLVDDLPRTTTELEKARAIRPFAALARERGGGLIVAIGHPRHRAPSVDDAEWRRIAAAVCAARGVQLFGFYVASGPTVRELTASAEAVA